MGREIILIMVTLQFDKERHGTVFTILLMFESLTFIRIQTSLHCLKIVENLFSKCDWRSGGERANPNSQLLARPPAPDIMHKLLQIV